MMSLKPLRGDDSKSWPKQFAMHSIYDLDFVIGQDFGLPVGTERKSAPEFRRRITAAAISYQLNLKSIDYTLKRYVKEQLYEDRDISLGDATSDYLRESVSILEEELKLLHSQGEAKFGVFGAELSLYRVPYALDTVRMLANRGLLLEGLPILRLCLEMACWASVAFYLQDEDKVVALKAQNCITSAKRIYPTVGNLYGYLSAYSHWGHVVHGQFLDFSDDKVGILKASVTYRAMTLALCLVLLDVLLEVIRCIYSDQSHSLILQVQGTALRDKTRKTYQCLSAIAGVSDLSEVREIQSLMHSET